MAISGLFHVTTDYLLKEQSASQESAKLDRLVLRFLGYAQDMDSISRDLVDIMRDGIIDDVEKVRMNEIVKTLNEVAHMIEEVKLALRNNGVC